MKKDEKDQCTGGKRPYIVAVNREKKEASLYQPDCGSWSCPYCAEKRKQEWFLRAYKGTSHLLEKGSSVGFITLTTRGGKGRTREKSLQAFAAGWPKLRKRAEYRQGKLSYILVPEQHKNGIIHAHVLSTNSLSQRWWKDSAYKSGLGYMAKVSPLQSAGEGALYVTKYIGKHLEFGTWPKGFRRVRCSRDWPRIELPEEYPGIEFEVYTHLGDATWNAYMLEDAGYKLTVRLAPAPH